MKERYKKEQYRNIGDIVYGGRDNGHETTNRFVRYLMLIRYDGICQICKRKYGRINNKKYFSEFHVDHIIPYSRGGRNHIDNYQLLCEQCNLKKSNTIVEE